MKYSKIILLILLATGFVTCKKKDNTNNGNIDFFSPVMVDFYINMDLPTAADLKFPNGYFIQTNTGYKQRGVIVYNTGFTGAEEYVAFDRTCPFKPDSSCSYVSMDSSTLFFRCGQYYGAGKFAPCCNSKFTALNGSPVSGPAGRSLRQYYVGNYGSQLRVTNTPQ